MAYRPRKHTSKIETEKIRDLIFHVTQLWKLQRKSTEMVEKLWQKLPGGRVAVQIFRAGADDMGQVPVFSGLKL